MVGQVKADEAAVGSPANRMIIQCHTISKYVLLIVVDGVDFPRTEQKGLIGQS